MMKHKILFLTIYAIAMAASGCCCCSGAHCVNNGAEADSIELALLVNPFIGTDFTGNTYPGAQAPFGMVQLSPDNGLPGWDRIAGYYYPDSTIAGFSHTHLSGTGAGDLYDFSFMPVMLPERKADAPLGVYSRFDHSSEKASAGYYAVTLSDYDVRVELTATERVGVQRYTFPGGAAEVILNLNKAMNWDATVDTHVEFIADSIISGYRFSNGWARNQQLYFRTRFSRPWQSVQLDSFAIVDPDTHRSTGRWGYVARLRYETTPGEQLVVSTAISATSEQGAERNLSAEAPSDDFDATLMATQRAWQKALSAIVVADSDTTQLAKDRKTNFYTALYHAMLAPTIYSDVDGAYRGPDNKVHENEGFTNYSTFSLWDTFRAAHPLYTITSPHRVGDMVNSFLAFYDQNGRLPVWSFQGSETDMMIGYHAVPVIVDAYLKGIGDFDAERALAACVATSNIDDYRGIGIYKQNGYVPYDVNDPYNADNWSLSRTLEYAYDDYCIARMAQAMGKHDLASAYFNRSQNYRNVYNPATGFMQPRQSSGQWQPRFNPDEYTPHICESNAWHYLWSVQHDIPGLAALMGGIDSMAVRLDSMFNHHPKAEDSLPIFSTGMIGQYAHGNEPSHHVIYLNNHTRRPWLTAQYARQVMDQLYRNDPAGLSGNEDCGQMSAWYVFSAMGFYPVDPVSGKYELGTPIFPEIVLRLQNGKTFTVRANNFSSENIYVKEVRLNGKPYGKSYITHDDIMSGAVLEMEMTSSQGHCWY